MHLPLPSSVFHLTLPTTFRHPNSTPIDFWHIAIPRVYPLDSVARARLNGNNTRCIECRLASFWQRLEPTRGISPTDTYGDCITGQGHPPRKNGMAYNPHHYFITIRQVASDRITVKSRTDEHPLPGHYCNPYTPLAPFSA